MSGHVRAGVWLVFAVGFGLVTGGPAEAQVILNPERHWDEPVGGDFEDGANWREGAAPGPDDTAIFELDAAYTVDFNRDHTNELLLVRDGEITFDLFSGTTSYTYTLTGGSSTTDSPDDAFIVGYEDGDEATLTLRGGLVETSADTFLGRQTGSTGTLLLRDGARLGVTPDQLSGVGLCVGTLGTGTLRIEGASSVESNWGRIANSSPESRGTVIVTGTDSSWTVRRHLTVAGAGRGVLRIENRGVVEAAIGFVGLSSNSSGTAVVSGTGSRWINNGSLSIGYWGTGSLTIEGGGWVESADGAIAHLSDSSGTVTVQGAGSAWINRGKLNVGGGPVVADIDIAGGEGTLTVGPGARVHVEEALKIWDQGTVNLHGGTIRFDGYQRAETGVFNYLAGTVQLAGDREVGLDPVIEDLYGPSPVLPGHKGLAVEGTATLVLPMTIDGGTFTAGDLVNGGLIDFQRGTLGLTDATLSVASDGQFGDVLTIRDGQTYRADAGVSVVPGGRIVLEAGGVLVTPDLNNSGVLTGGGRIEGSIDNVGDTLTDQPRGEVRVNAGDHLLVTGSIENTSRVNVMPGGELEVRGLFVNGTDGGFIGFSAPGELYARDAVLRFSQGNSLLGTPGLTNEMGVIGFSFGTSDVFGTIRNEADGRIVVSGQSRVTFYDDVVNRGEVGVSSGSTAVWFGEVSGDGVFTGTGLNFFEGDVSPGMSPGTMRLEGDVAMGSLASLLIEIGGYEAGEAHDLFEVLGHLALDGALEVELVDGFLPRVGDAFDVLDWGSVEGEVASVALPALAGGLTWDDSELYTTGTLRVVPEPASLALLAAGGMTLLMRRRGGTPR